MQASDQRLITPYLEIAGLIAIASIGLVTDPRRLHSMVFQWRCHDGSATRSWWYYFGNWHHQRKESLAHPIHHAFRALPHALAACDQPSIHWYSDDKRNHE